MVGERAKPVEAFFDGLAEITYKIIDAIMKVAPLGVFALIMPVVAVNGPKVLLPLATVIAAVYIGCVLHMVVVYIAVRCPCSAASVLCAFSREFFRRCWWHSRPAAAARLCRST
jgi:Na+/H+-dicarboxylate symporter